MASIVFVGFPFLIGQAVGIGVDVTLVRTGRSIWPFHGLCLGLGLLIGWVNFNTKTNGPPTAADYNRVMIMSLFIGLATSFLTYGCFWILWKGIMSCCCLLRTMRNGQPATSRHEVLGYSSNEEEDHGGITMPYADNFVVE